VPEAYGRWSSLKSITLKNTSISGTFPVPPESSWLKLQEFYIDGSQMTGRPPDFRLMTDLRSYRLENTPVSTDTTTPFWMLAATALPPNLTSVMIGMRSHNHPSIAS
jgi:hypothetical protein